VFHHTYFSVGYTAIKSMKEWAKKAILASGALRFGAGSQPAGTAILMYHSVLPGPEQHADLLGGIAHSEFQFREQMELLAREYQPVSLDGVVKSLRSGEPLKKRSVVVTFDDGYRDNFEVAVPILNHFGIPATFYVTVDCVENRRLPWPSRLRFAIRKTKLAAWTDSHAKTWKLDSDSSREETFATLCSDCCRLSGEVQEDFVQRVERNLEVSVPTQSNSFMMDFDQVRGLVRNGHSVGSHTMTHPNMAYVSVDDARQEFVESKARLEEQISTPITHFAYPCPALSPHWNARTVDQSRTLGYDSAVTTNSGLTQSGDNPLCLKRLRPTKTADGLRWNLECAFAGRAV